ncbi:hypothetical protein [Pseudomonas sp. NPDC089734]|uniref:hypothetical protein n=1 Tax=Pseudomonas sp. NPDC089734 TaxID=3364469 RepID=UPI003822826D
MQSETGRILRTDFFSAAEQMIARIKSHSGRTDRILEALLARIGNMRVLQLITLDEAKELRRRANSAMLE